MFFQYFRGEERLDLGLCGFMNLPGLFLLLFFGHGSILALGLQLLSLILDNQSDLFCLLVCSFWHFVELFESIPWISPPHLAWSLLLAGALRLHGCLHFALFILRRGRPPLPGHQSCRGNHDKNRLSFVHRCNLLMHMNLRLIESTKMSEPRNFACHQDSPAKSPFYLEQDRIG